MRPGSSPTFPAGPPDDPRSGAPETAGGPPPRWLVLTLRPPPRGEEILLVDALHRLGARAVDREGERLVAWLPPPDDVDDFLEEARWVVRASVSHDDSWLEWRWESAAGWQALWEGELAERRVSERLVVMPFPAGEADPALDPGAPRAVPSPERPAVIRLRPGLAFGTAEHPTTRTCLRLLDELLLREVAGDAAPPRLLDVGTGSGVLAIGAALLGAGGVLALESDANACDDARRNAAANGVGDRVEVRQRTAGADDLVRLGTFRGILANIQPVGLLPLLPGLARALEPGGWLVVSGIPRDERRDVMRSAVSLGLILRKEIVEEGWWSGVMGKEQSGSGRGGVMWNEPR
jgi:ribosomal protein L11 methyltransferase